jgi:hypothetical protein
MKYKWKKAYGSARRLLSHPRQITHEHWKIQDKLQDFINVVPHKAQLLAYSIINERI